MEELQPVVTEKEGFEIEDEPIKTATLISLDDLDLYARIKQIFFETKFLSRSVNFFFGNRECWNQTGGSEKRWIRLSRCVILLALFELFEKSVFWSK